MQADLTTGGLVATVLALILAAVAVRIALRRGGSAREPAARPDRPDEPEDAAAPRTRTGTEAVPPEGAAGTNTQPLVRASLSRPKGRNGARGEPAASADYRWD